MQRTRSEVVLPGSGRGGGFRNVSEVESRKQRMLMQQFDEHADAEANAGGSSKYLKGSAKNKCGVLEQMPVS